MLYNQELAPSAKHAPPPAACKQYMAFPTFGMWTTSSSHNNWAAEPTWPKATNCDPDVACSITVPASMNAHLQAASANWS